MLLAQISDLHIKRPGALAYRRVDTGAYLARTVAALNALEPRPDAVIMTGDLVDQGDPEQYAHLKTLLAPLQIPYFLLVGNHDERTALRAAFADRAELHSGGEFVHYAVDIGALRVIALDSMVPGASAGNLCDARLAWLATQLDAAQGKPTVVALHHPPFVCGIGHMDELRLDPIAADRLAALAAGPQLDERLRQWLAARLGPDPPTRAEAAERAGFPMARVGFHGNNKSVAEIARAIEVGVGSIVIDSDIEPLDVDASLGEVTRSMANYNMISLPVVDSERRLLGAVTVDDVLDHILPDDWREGRHDVRTPGESPIRAAIGRAGGKS